MIALEQCSLGEYCPFPHGSKIIADFHFSELIGFNQPNSIANEPGNNKFSIQRDNRNIGESTTELRFWKSLLSHVLKNHRSL